MLKMTLLCNVWTVTDSLHIYAFFVLVDYNLRVSGQSFPYDPLQLWNQLTTVKEVGPLL